MVHVRDTDGCKCFREGINTQPTRVWCNSIDFTMHELARPNGNSAPPCTVALLERSKQRLRRHGTFQSQAKRENPRENNALPLVRKRKLTQKEPKTKT
ncbi:hypothetical protein Golob_018577, partial [Gossypium lobatum]|nr:hypothetical protein [Gossypium lobatum]